VLNHKNFGSYTTSELNANDGLPVQNQNVAYSPRLAQFGFRLSF
jgi:hypothetical protein